MGIDVGVYLYMHRIWDFSCPSHGFSCFSEWYLWPASAGQRPLVSLLILLFFLPKFYVQSADAPALPSKCISNLTTSVKVLHDLGPFFTYHSLHQPHSLLSCHSSHNWPPCWHAQIPRVLPSGDLCAETLQITTWHSLSLFRSLLKYHLIRKTFLTNLYKIFHVK